MPNMRSARLPACRFSGQTVNTLYTLAYLKQNCPILYDPQDPPESFSRLGTLQAIKAIKIDPSRYGQFITHSIVLIRKI